MSAESNPAQKNESVFQRLHFILRFARFAGPFWAGPDKWRAISMTVALFLLTVAQVVLAIWTNYWNGALFDALGERSVPKFLTQIGIFIVIFILTMAVTATHLQVKKRLQVNWRRWLTRRVVDRWMSEKHHYQLIFTPGEHDNPDGRIAEDINNATEQAIALSHTLVYSFLVLGTFIDILLNVAGSTTVNVSGSSYHVPGYMVFLAFGYAGVGTVLGLTLGRPLVRATNSLQTAEANFRYGLARAREKAEEIALVGGERVERHRFVNLFVGIRESWVRQTFALTGIMFFTSGYGALLPVFPILVAAPQYIAGTMTLGVLMQTAQAFQKLTSALSWPVDNLSDMAKWRASANRVMSLADDLQKIADAKAAPDENRIAVGRANTPTLAINKLQIVNPDGQLVLDGFNLEVKESERVLIDGDSGAAVNLFKVVAGLWPWGRGEVLLPRDRTILFMPQRPYIPNDSLRAVLAYPNEPDVFDDNAFHSALDNSGLGYLRERLDEVSSWERVLTFRGQQRIGFARLFLHKPNWIFMEEATDAFDAAAEAKLLDAVICEFPKITVIGISFNADHDHFYTRKLSLNRAPDGQFLFGGPPVKHAASLLLAEDEKIF